MRMFKIRLTPIDTIKYQLQTAWTEPLWCCGYGQSASDSKLGLLYWLYPAKQTSTDPAGFQMVTNRVVP
tara:strand:+ start:4625 stop:4831 length:207 start_codon:yes stop_codon:yes gene_type:complete